jgi:Zn-dependent oligopeptidase
LSFAIFETIQKNEAQFEEQCMRFRDEVMKPGGSKPGIELLKNFFKEDVNLQKLVERFGVVNI